MDSSSPTRRTNPEVVPAARLLTLGSQAISALALVNFLLVLWSLINQSRQPAKTGWPEALLVVTAALATLASLSRALPGQKVLLATIIIGLLGGLAHGIGAATSFPFGPFVYSDAAGPKLFNMLAWPLPLLWIISILNSRGVARLILRPWRKLKNYGLWLIGITAILVLLFDLALEPFAAYVNHFWLWLPTKFPITWYGTPLVNFVGWLLTALLILAFTTPTLTQKSSRSKKNQVDYHPLCVWLLALSLFATSAFRNQLWPAVAVCMLTGIVTTIFALRGARW